MHNLIIAMFAAVSAFAHSQDPYQSRCQMALERTVAFIGERPEDIVWLQNPGVGVRGWVAGAWPPITAKVERRAHEQAIMSWFDTIAVMPSIEAARAHDLMRIPYKQVNYLISDRSIEDLLPSESVVGVTDEEKIARRQAAARRFAELFDQGRARIVYFRELKHDPELYEGVSNGGIKFLYKKGTPKAEFTRENRIARELVDISPSDARLAFHADEMGITRDGGGVRFQYYGYFRLHQRGVMDWEATFAPKPGTFTPNSSTVSKSYNLLRNLITKSGWKFTWNTSIDDVIALAKETKHGVRDLAEEQADAEPNSRYLEPHVEEMTREAFAAGDAFTLELRDKEGVLRASGIGFFGPNQLIMMDTVSGQNAPKPPTKQNPQWTEYQAIDLRKAMIVGGLVWARELGYPRIDSQVVSSTTSTLKAYYDDADNFLKVMNAGPPPPRPARTGTWIPRSYEELTLEPRPRILPEPPR